MKTKHTIPETLIKLPTAGLYALMSVFQGKSMLEAIGEPEHYQAKKLEMDKNKFNLGE